MKSSILSPPGILGIEFAVVQAYPVIPCLFPVDGNLSALSYILDAENWKRLGCIAVYSGTGST